MRRNSVTRALLGVAGAAVVVVAASAATPHRGDARKRGASVIPTFNRDIAPIVFNHCSSCHRPGQTGPFLLLNYKEVAARGRALTAVTVARTMPPWKATGDCAFRDENKLTDAEIAEIGKWVNAGMPEGRAADKPTPPNFVQGWQLGKPDLIVKMDRPFHVPADGPDIYRHFVLPLNLTEDKWLSAIEYHPKARTVVHHCLFFYDTTGSLRQRDGLDGQPGIGGGMAPIPGGGGRDRRGAGGGGRFGGGGNRTHRGGGLFGLVLSFGSSGTAESAPTFGGLGGWAVGAQPRFLPDGLAYFLPKGADLLLSTHFHPSGRAEDEVTEVGLYFAKSAPTRQFTGVQIPPAFGALSGISIPPGAKNYMIEDTFTLPVDVRAFGATGHAHFIGKDMLLTATLPNGTTKTLLSIPKWDFAWQDQYQYKQFVDLPKGTKLHAVIHYDNSADNPYNPSHPPRLVTWGEQTTDEMGSMILQVVAVHEADVEELRSAYRDHVRQVAIITPAIVGRMFGASRGGRE